MSIDDDLPDPVAYARGLSRDELLAYKDTFGEGSREWIIAKHELARRFPTNWQKAVPWIWRAFWMGLILFLYFRWR